MKRLVNVILVSAIAILLWLGFRELFMYMDLQQENDALRDSVVQIPKVDPEDQDSEDYLDPNDPFNRHIDFDSLKATNEDIVGWLYVPDTTIDYPILVGDSDEKYVHRNYEGGYSYPGSIFAFAGVQLDNDDKIVLFGHNMMTRQMFGCLREYKSSDYGRSHMKAYIYTPDRTKECTLFSTFICYRNDELFGLKEDDVEKSLDEWLSSLNQRSSYALDLPENAGQIFTLSTCNGGSGVSTRLTVHFTVTKEKYVLD